MANDEHVALLMQGVRAVLPFLIVTKRPLRKSDGRDNIAPPACSINSKPRNVINQMSQSLP